MSNCRAEAPCSQPGGCTCGLHDWQHKNENSSAEVAPMTSGEAFGKAVDVIDEATEEFAKFAKQGADAYFAKLEEGKEFFESMSAPHLLRIAAYMESAAESMALKMRKAFKDAAE